MHSSVFSVQAGARLLAAALRDPADIIAFDTVWEFMRAVEGFCRHLTDGEKASVAYRELVAGYTCISQLQHDITAVGEDWLRVGPQLIEAFATYAEQLANLLALLLDRHDASHLAALLQPFEQVTARIEREVQEIPGGPAVQDAFAAFQVARNAHAVGGEDIET
jgi:hypothetical protein